MDKDDHVGVIKRYIRLDHRRTEIHSLLQNEYPVNNFNADKALISTMVQSVIAVYRPCYVEGPPGFQEYWYEFQGVRILGRGE